MKRWSIAVPGAVLGLWLAACASVPPPRLILLTNDEARPTVAGTTRPLLAVRGVQLPEYLLRSAVVYRASDAELARFPDAEWAERLNVAVTRWIAQQLAAELPQYDVHAYGGAAAPALALEVTLTRFEAVAPQTFQLRGDWRLARPGAGEPVAEAGLSADVPLSALTPEGVVAAMNTALKQASQSIAERLRALQAGEAPAPSGAAPAAPTGN